MKIDVGLREKIKQEDILYRWRPTGKELLDIEEYLIVKKENEMSGIIVCEKMGNYWYPNENENMGDINLLIKHLVDRNNGLQDELDAIIRVQAEYQHKIEGKLTKYGITID